MKKYLSLILLLLVVCSCGNSQIKEAVNGQQAKTGLSEKQIELVFEKTKSFPNQTQLSFAVIKDGKVRFYGVKRVQDSLYSVDNSKSVFEIGSITKVFTATLLSHVVVAGKIKLDEKINDKLKVRLKDEVLISYKQLSNHTSGLPRMPTNFASSSMLNPMNPYKNYGKDQLEEYLVSKLKVSQPPGEKYEYSNLGAGLLGYALCSLANTNYQALVKEIIFSRYNMTSTTTQRTDVEKQLVQGRDAIGDVASNWDLGALVSAGGILSTVEDLSKFGLAQFDAVNKELELTRVPTFSVSETMEIGLGWHIIKPESGDTWHWHNGGTAGYTSSMALDVKRKNGIIILSNVSAFNKNMKKIDELCFGLMKTLAE